MQRSVCCGGPDSRWSCEAGPRFYLGIGGCVFKRVPEHLAFCRHRIDTSRLGTLNLEGGLDGRHGRTMDRHSGV